MAVSDTLRQQVLTRDNNTCRACGFHCELTLQADHVIPRSAGGADTLENLQALCGFCNNTKGGRQVPPMVIRESPVGFGDYDTVQAERELFRQVCERATLGEIEELARKAKEWKAQGVRGLTIRKRLEKLTSEGHIRTILKAIK